MAVLACAFVLLAAILLAYVFLIGYKLASLGLAAVLPAVAIVAGALAGVVFAFVKASGVLFGQRDYDLMMSLPIPVGTVVLSRLGALFAMAVLFSVGVCLPLFAAYFVVEGLSAAQVALAAVGAVLAPLAPTSVAVFLAFALSAAAARFRHANVVFVVFALAATIGVVVGVTWLGAGSDQLAGAAGTGSLAALSEGLVAGVCAAWPPAAWFVAAFSGAEGGWLGLAAFVAVSVAVPALALAAIAHWYRELNGALAARGGGRRFQAAQIRTSQASPLAALVVKELRRIVTLPIYALNCALGLVLMVVAAVALGSVGIEDILTSGVINGVEVSDMQEVVQTNLIEGVVAAMPWVFAFCSACSVTAAPATSLEGSSAWLMSTWPLSARTVYASKLLANFLLGAVAIAVSVVVLLATGALDVSRALESAVAAAGTLVGFACLSLTTDLRRPNFGFVSAQEVVKRGAPMMLAILGGCVFVVVGFAAAYLLTTEVSAAAGHVANVALPLLVAAVGAGAFLHATRDPRLHVA